MAPSLPNCPSHAPNVPTLALGVVHLLWQWTDGPYRGIQTAIMALRSRLPSASAGFPVIPARRDSLPLSRAPGSPATVEEAASNLRQLDVGPFSSEEGSAVPYFDLEPDLRLHYDEQGQGRPIVCLPGWAGSARFFRITYPRDCQRFSRVRDTRMLHAVTRLGSLVFS
jgi:hypothetical protein